MSSPLASPDLHLLMVHADDHTPVDGVGDEGAHSEGNEETAMPSHLWDDSAAPDDLVKQRWGVIAPQGPEGDRLLALIAPLMAHRREQQGGEAVTVVRLPPGMDTAAAEDWRQRSFHSDADLDYDVPRYVAILGDFDQISLEVQQVLATHRAFPGRIVFDEETQYEAYVDKVLRWEKHGAQTEQTRGEAVLYTAHDGTAATRVGHGALMAPGQEVLQRRWELGQLPAAGLLANQDDDADPDAFFALSQGTLPRVMFSMSHGDGPPRRGWTDNADQRARQGAMSFGSSGSLQASDFAQGAFLPGGIWFMLACFGAGTPAVSSYHHWLKKLEAAGQFSGAAQVLGALDAAGRGFAGAVPKAALANVDGPLAFMGHMDLAWTYGFQDAEEQTLKRPARYMGVLRSLLEQHRAGVALHELYRHVGSVNSSLSVLYDADARAEVGGLGADPRAAKRGHLWMVRQDLQAYVLMGDPAVRLPLKDPKARVAPVQAAPPVVQAAPPPRGEELAAEGGEPVKLSMETWEFEELLGQHLAGDLSIGKLADELGLGRSEVRGIVDRYRRAGRRALGLPEED